MTFFPAFWIIDITAFLNNKSRRLHTLLKAIVWLIPKNLDISLFFVHCQLLIAVINAPGVVQTIDR